MAHFSSRTSAEGKGVEGGLFVRLGYEKAKTVVGAAGYPVAGVSFHKR